MAEEMCGINIEFDDTEGFEYFEMPGIPRKGETVRLEGFDVDSGGEGIEYVVTDVVWVLRTDAANGESAVLTVKCARHGGRNE